MRKVLTLVMVGLLMTLAAGLIGQTQEGPIKIGGVGPLSEPGSVASGQLMQMAMKMAVEELNANGGILSRPVELVFEDTAATPEIASAAFEKLITKDNVVGVVGEFHSSAAVAEIEVAHKYGVPFLIAEAWSDSLTAAQYKEVFRVAPSVTLFYGAVAEWIKAAGFKNIVSLVENTDWGIDVDEKNKKFLKDEIDAGLITWTSITAEKTITDFTPQLLSFKAMDPRPDLLMATFTGTGEYLIPKQACEIGLGPSIDTAVFAVGTDALLPEFWETTGQCGVNVITKDVGHPILGRGEAFYQFRADFEAEYGRTPIFACDEAYDTVMILAQAIEAAGSTDADKIIEELEKIVYDGVRGRITFNLATTPDWAYHQWMGAIATIIQYTAYGQTPDESRLLWPPKPAW